MFEYKAQMRNYKFVMQELLNCDEHYQNLGFEDAGEDHGPVLNTYSFYLNGTKYLKPKHIT
jgi:hypothetical protein